jgi:LemA protein
MAGAKSTEEKIAGANAETSALSRLLVVMENYPQLKSNELFMNLSTELAGTENRIAAERQRYNEKVREYNTTRHSFPSNITGSLFGFKDYPYFEAPADAKAVPKVDFGKGK